MYGYIYKITVPTSIGNYYYIGQKKSDTLIETYFGSGKKINDWFLKHTKHKSRWCPKEIADKVGVIREILEWCNSQTELSQKEIFYIEKQRLSGNCLNIADGGENGWSKESHAKSVQTRKEKGSYKLSNKQKEALKKSHLGKSLTENQKLALSIANRGANNGMSKEKGGHTKEWKDLHSKQLKGKKHDYCAKKVICIETKQIFRTIGEASKWAKCSSTMISIVCRKVKIKGSISNTANGYHFCFLKDYKNE